MKIEDLKTAEINPRTIRTDRFRDLKESIEKRSRFLELRPIIYDPDTMEIIAGNMRIKALAELGYTDIPKKWIKPATDWSEEEKKKFMLLDNISFGQWDYEIMKKWDRSLLANIPFREKEIEPLYKTELPASTGPDLDPMEIRFNEHHDYVIFVFDKESDYVSVLSKLEIKRRDFSMDNRSRKIGIGRVLKGQRLIQLLDK